MDLIVLIISISILILVHEWGHFASARFLNIKVEEFGFGFPPTLFYKFKNGVKYSFNLLPFGGYVKIYGESGEDDGNKTSFSSRPAYQRFFVLAAGVFMNFVLAWILFSAVSALGSPQPSAIATTGPIKIMEVIANSPAENMGLHIGDSIIKLESQGTVFSPNSAQDVSNFVYQHLGENISVTVNRGGQTLTLQGMARLNAPPDQGPLGFAPAQVENNRVPIYQAPWTGLVMVYYVTAVTLQGLYFLLHSVFLAHTVPSQVSGPVGIYFISQQVQNLGFLYFIQFIGVISVNLAILNFLPLPALDGGRVLFLVIEKFRGVKIKPSTENFIHGVGFAVLILLMILVTIHDVNVFF